MMAKVDQFLDFLVNYDKENIPSVVLQALEPYLADPEFEPEFVRTKSGAAAGLCSWVINVVKFYEVYCDVEPKRIALQKANDELQAAQDKLALIKAKIAVRTPNLKPLAQKHTQELGRLLTLFPLLAA